jgi:hypothetical protein
MIIDLLLVIIIGAVTWCVASEGAWGAVLTFLSVLFSGLLAMNFYESLAGFLSAQFSSFEPYSDFMALMGLFALFTTGFRMLGEQISPVQIELDGPVYQGCRWAFSIISGYVTMAFLLTALHTAPLPREFLDFKPERANLFGAASPDRQWLGFTQHVSEKVLSSDRIFDGMIIKGMVLQGEKHPVWATFPIRYASRRESYATPNQAKIGLRTLAPAPGGGGGTGAAGGGGGGF